VAEILQFESTGRKPPADRSGGKPDCAHRRVVAYTAYRTVRCALCGAELDPFDVLVEMFKGAPPTGSGQGEDRKLRREIARRRGIQSAGDKPSRK